MQDKEGKIFPGYISGKVSGGLFVELRDHMVEGFCPLENIPNASQTRKRYRAFKKQPFRYSPGDYVKVKLEKAILEELLIEFSIVQ